MTKKIQWTNDKRKLGDLIPWPRNPRQIKKDEAKRLSDSLHKFDQVETIAIGPDSEIYNGHQRLNVWIEEYGPDFEVDVRISSRALTEKEREKLTVYLHKGAAGEWDFDILANEFEVDDLIDWGFTEKELQIEGWDLGEDGDAPEPQIDKAEELQKKWEVERGQIWEIGRHRLMCGDSSLDIGTLAVNKPDLIWADPPYHVGKKFGLYEEGVDWDLDFQTSWINAVIEVAPEAQRYICFAQAQSRNAIMTFKPNRILVWCKPFALMRANEWDWAYEFIAWCYDTEKPNYFDKPDGTLSFDWQEIRSAIHGQDGKYHLTQKPKELPELHIKASCPIDGIVLDPFLGSGTTMVAAEQLNRICYGMEIEPKYCSVTLERMSDMGLEPKLVKYG